MVCVSTHSYDIQTPSLSLSLFLFLRQIMISLSLSFPLARHLTTDLPPSLLPPSLPCVVGELRYTHTHRTYVRNDICNDWIPQVNGNMPMTLLHSLLTTTHNKHITSIHRPKPAVTSFVHTNCIFICTSVLCWATVRYVSGTKRMFVSSDCA